VLNTAVPNIRPQPLSRSVGDIAIPH
jgi:hypothetical protein